MHPVIDRLETRPCGLSLGGCENPSSIALFIGCCQNRGPHLICAPSSFFYEIEQSLLFFNPYLRVFKLPALDMVFSSDDIAAKRVRWLNQALKAHPQDVFIASLDSLLQKTIPQAAFEKEKITLKEGGLLPQARRLQALGYSPSQQVEEEGFFSERGAVLDIFSPAHPRPLRIESIGDQMESIRFFDPISGRSTERRLSAEIIPSRELLFSSEFRLKACQKLKSLSDSRPEMSQSIDLYLKKLSRNVFFPEAVNLIPFMYEKPDQALDFFKRPPLIWNFNPNKRDEKIKNLSPFHHFLKEKNFFKELCLKKSPKKPLEKQIVSLHPLIQDSKEKWPFSIIKNIKPLSPLKKRKPRFLFISALSENQLDQIQMHLKKEGLSPVITSKKERLWSEWKRQQMEDPLKVHLIPDLIPHHFESPDSVFIKGDLWLGKAHIPAKEPSLSFSHSKLNAFRFSKISVGDLLVDKIHGVGIYQGLKKMSFGQKTNEQKINEYVELEYKNENKLYVPVQSIKRLFLFKSQIKAPILDELGQSSWKMKLGRARKAIQSLVLDLMKVHSARTKVKRKAFGPKSPELKIFEQEFPFEETKDQALAIEDIFKDLSRPYPMDRLIVGGSGFGKTEAAMRAVFKVVEEGCQAVFLAPTTILSLQHFENFKKRFADWPMRTELVSRIVSPKKIKAVLEDLARGRVDILIGTHRLLSPDVQFKNLGLIVIDEEHRFGVRQKEKLKKLKFGVDCLYMSATPIPRTLNMSLSKAKDISLIQTAPQNRKPPQVFIIPFEEDKIKTAVLREIERGGQILFVHNRIEDLHKMELRLKTILPEVSMRTAHGRMDEKELEQIILNFFNRQFDLLLCTSIVETGMDFEKTNTIFINNSHKMGLSQLYQLRGRVGRRAFTKPYCYFIIPEDFPFDAAAVKRLNFLQTHNELGSGYQVALYDLEMRGGGEFFGHRQSGQIENIGYDLYLQMLSAESAPSNLREGLEEDFEPEMKLPWPAFIPNSYIPHDRLRLMYYKHLSELGSEDNMESFEDELRDHFGPLPPEVKNLIGQAMIQRLCRKMKIRELKLSGLNLHLTFLDPKKDSIKKTLNKNEGWIQIYDSLNQILSSNPHSVNSQTRF